MSLCVNFKLLSLSAVRKTSHFVIGLLDLSVLVWRLQVWFGGGFG